MHHHFRDITSRIAEPPIWFDENAVPRYCEFAPNEGAHIYAQQIALVLIACQQCEDEFKVAMSWDQMEQIFAGRKVTPLDEHIFNKTLHYGDPPNTGHCSGGATMNCIDLRVLEFYRKDDRCNWVRDNSLEIELEDEE